MSSNNCPEAACIPDGALLGSGRPGRTCGLMPRWVLLQGKVVHAANLPQGSSSCCESVGEQTADLQFVVTTSLPGFVSGNLLVGLFLSRR